MKRGLIGRFGLNLMTLPFGAPFFMGHGSGKVVLAVALLCFVGGDALLDELRIDVACAEVAVAEDLLVQGDCRLDTVDAELLERALHDLDGVAARAAVDDELRDHRVVVRLDREASRHA